jgi:hypothetical protein
MGSDLQSSLISFKAVTIVFATDSHISKNCRYIFDMEQSKKQISFGIFRISAATSNKYYFTLNLKFIYYCEIYCYVG